MSTKILCQYDFTHLELLNVRIQNLATAPSSPSAGWVYFDTADGVFRCYNGTAWVDLGGVSFDDVEDLAPGNTGAEGTSESAARADHVHELPDWGSVTAQTSFGASSGNGSADTFARSDHTHGTPAHNDTAHSGIHLNALAAPTANVAMNSKKLTGLADGTAATDSVTLGQVQGLIATGTNKTAVRIATTGNDALSGLTARDGVTPVAGDRVLVRAQTDAEDNGIYVAASGSWSRATDADISAEVKAGLSVWVNEGTANGDTRWVLTTDDPITLGTTELTFTQDFAATSTTAGDGLTATGNVLNVGAGLGIEVTTDTVKADTDVVAFREVVRITGDGTTTAFAIEPSGFTPGEFPSSVSVWDVDSGEMVVVDVSRSLNEPTVTFAVAPSNGKEYDVAVAW